MTNRLCVYERMPPDFTVCGVVVVMAYWCWAEDRISLVALAELAQLVLSKRVCSAILCGKVCH